MIWADCSSCCSRIYCKPVTRGQRQSLKPTRFGHRNHEPRILPTEAPSHRFGESHLEFLVFGFGWQCRQISRLTWKWWVTRWNFVPAISEGRIIRRKYQCHYCRWVGWSSYNSDLWRLSALTDWFTVKERIPVCSQATTKERRRKHLSLLQAV